MRLALVQRIDHHGRYAITVHRDAYDEWLTTNVAVLDILLHAASRLVDADVDAFNKLVRAMGDSAATDKVVTSLLVTTKKAVSRQSDAGERVARRLAAQDDDDLL